MNTKTTCWTLDLDEAALSTEDLLGLGVAGAIVYIATDSHGWDAYTLVEGEARSTLDIPLGTFPSMVDALLAAEAWARDLATVQAEQEDYLAALQDNAA